MHDGSHDRMFAIRPITLMHIPLFDHLTTHTIAVASSYNTRFCCKTNTPGHKTYRKIYYISLHNARLMALQIVRAFKRALFSCNIYKTDCEFLRSHDILVLSARATIVKDPYTTHIHIPTQYTFNIIGEKACGLCPHIHTNCVAEF